MSKTTIALACTALAFSAGFLGSVVARTLVPDSTLGPSTRLESLEARLEELRTAQSDMRRTMESWEREAVVLATRDSPDAWGGDRRDDQRPGVAGTPAEPFVRTHEASDLQARVSALEGQAADVAGRTRELMVWAAGLDAPPRDVAAERSHFEALATPALLKQARELSISRRGATPAGIDSAHDRALLVCEVLLDRELEADERARVMTIAGTIYRTRGEIVTAEATLEMARGLVAADSEEAVGATAQLAFSAVSQKQFRRAADLFLSVHSMTTVTDEVRARFRRLGGTFLALVDAQGGRRELEGMLSEFGDASDENVLAEVARAREDLARLDGE